MDFDNTGYITVHAFISMMMKEDEHMRSSASSSRYYANVNRNISNTNSNNLYKTYSGYGYSETQTNPRKSYEYMASSNPKVHVNHAYSYHHGYNNNNPHKASAPHYRSGGRYLSPDSHYFGTFNPHPNVYSEPSSSDQERFIKSRKKKKKRKRKKKRHHKNNSGQYDEYHAPNHCVSQECSLSSNEERAMYYDDVEEKHMLLIRMMKHI